MVISISGLFAMISGSALGLTATDRSLSSLDPGALALRAHVRARSVPLLNPRQFVELYFTRSQSCGRSAARIAASSSTNAAHDEAPNILTLCGEKPEFPALVI